MEQAIKYIELFTTLVDTLIANGADATVHTGRKYDRIIVAGSTRYFVDKATWEIFGAKSDFQHNPRRLFGTLNTITDYDWSLDVPAPLPNTDAEMAYLAREAEIASKYKLRGRPKKQSVTAGN